MTIRTLVLLLLAVSPGAANTLEGTVQDAVSDAPVGKATVRLNSSAVDSRAGVNVAVGSGWIPRGSTVTDASGHFRFDNVASGRYQVTVIHRDYSAGATKSVNLETESSPGSLVIKLTPGAAISGRVVDEDGEPLQGCYFTLYHASGRPGSGRGTGSDEQGEYQISHIPAGRYKIAARCMSRPFEPRPLTPINQPVDPSMAYPPQFYPQGTSTAEAQELDLPAGARRDGVDFQMRPARTYSVRVALEGVDPGADPSNPLTVQLVRGSGDDADPVPVMGLRLPGSSSFRFPAVFPGSYHVLAFAGGPLPMAASMPLEVSDRPVGITLPLRPAGDVRGRVEFEPDPQQPTMQRPLSSVSINVMPQSGHMYGYNQRPAQPDESGNFVLKSVVPVPARIEVWGGSFFVKSLRYGGDEVKDGAVDFSAGTGGELQIRLSTRMASLSGHTNPGANIWISLVNDRQSWRSRAWGATADPQGNFRISGLAPGRYRVGAGTPSDASPSGGQEITLTEGENTTLDVKVVE